MLNLTREQTEQIASNLNQIVEEKDYQTQIDLRGEHWWFCGVEEDLACHLINVNDEDQELDVELTEEEVVSIIVQTFAQLDLYQMLDVLRYPADAK